MSSENITTQNITYETARRYSESLGPLVAVLWIIGALRSFAVVGLGLDGWPALVWAVLVLIISVVLVATFVGALVWPFVMGALSSLFGASPSQWNPPASITSLGITLVVSAVVGYLLGRVLGYIIGWVIGKLRQSRA